MTPLSDLVLPYREQMAIPPIGGARISDQAVFGFQCIVGRQRDRTPGIDLTVIGNVGHHLVKPIGLRKESVERQLIGYPQQDQDGTGDPNGKTGDVNQGIGTALFQIAEGYHEVVFEHKKVLWSCTGNTVKGDSFGVK